MTTIATMLGADEVTAQRDMTDMLEFEIKLANVSTLLSHSLCPLRRLHDDTQSRIEFDNSHTNG